MLMMRRIINLNTGLLLRMLTSLWRLGHHSQVMKMPQWPRELRRNVTSHQTAQCRHSRGIHTRRDNWCTGIAWSIFDIGSNWSKQMTLISNFHHPTNHNQQTRAQTVTPFQPANPVVEYSTVYYTTTRF